jgi:molybdopterin molybdotransferase
MDGIAVRIADLTGGQPWSLPLQSVVAAGDSPDQNLKPGYAVKVMTGAPVISGADTVIKVEDVSFEGNQVLIADGVAKGQYVRPVGDDIHVGDSLFRAGESLTPVDIGVLASVGLTRVSVIPRPRTALLCSGSELAQPGTPLLPGQIYDSNRSVLQALIEKLGLPQGEIVTMVPDNKESLKEVLKRCLEASDLVITTGGVSMGDFDYLPDVIRQSGGEILFHKALVKPGKPILFARIDDSWILSLPGNPVSVVAGYHLYVRRVIARMMGQDCEPSRVQAVLHDDVTVQGDRLNLIGVKLQEEGNQIVAYPSLRQDSGRLSSIKGINGFILMNVDIRTLAAGDTVEAERLY